MTMRIVSWNTNGLRGTINNGMWEPFVASAKPDIICLQETKSEPQQLPPEFIELTKKWHSSYSWSKVKKGYSGVAIISKEKPYRVDDGFGHPEFDDEGRTLVAYFEDFVLINCYFPNGGGGPHRLKYKLEFYDAFLEFINSLRKKHNVIFTGDVNTAHQAIDLARPKENETHTGFLPVERAWMDKLVKKGWVDVYRHFFPAKADAYTYWDQKSGARARNVGWRIDYFFTTEDVVPYIKKTSIHSDIYGSDHCPLSIDIDFIEE
ncbi:MAG: hypothetical protein RL641_864 [Candidatus Parcubacteria bacterium]|jgi:exodeoxyribonuclease-3